MMRVMGASLLMSCALWSSCHTKSPPQLEVTQATVQPLLDRGAAYMTINNTGARTDDLLSVACDCASTVSMHEMHMDGDVMRMSPVERIRVPGYGTTELKPGGLHLMLEGVDLDIKNGSKVNMKLHFDRSGDVEVVAEVRRP
jgi:periplasmic copper chaperone A